MRGKVSREDKELEILPLLGVPQKHQVNRRNIYRESLWQNHADLVLGASVFVSPCEFCLVASVGNVLLVSLISSESYKHMSCFALGYP